jgi:hypothetical protein
MGYTECPNGCGNLMTDEYADQFDQCSSCHVPTDVKLYRCFGRNQ